ncbi:MAG TPA: DedA family protein [Candidatus Pacebacteria bacterium]|nr:DedA family protein [Candidatus Paceibacterota bacterium]
MDGQLIIQFLSEYGYWIILPLMIIEGPIVTLIAAFMASLGVFNIYVIFLLSILGDVLGDVIFYWIGCKGGIHFVRRVGKYIGITEELVVKMEKFFASHGGKTIFAVKSTTGLCWATFIAAGIVKMPFRKFVGYSVLGGLVWSGFLVIMGYFFGYLYEQIVDYINYSGLIIGGLAVIFFVGLGLYKKYETKDMFKTKEVAQN